MTSRSDKLAARLTNKQRQAILKAISKLEAGDDTGLDIRPLKGYKNIYRARVGDYRILFSRDNKQFELIELSKRDDQTYRDF